MAVIQKNTSDIRQNEQTGLQTLSGFLARSKNGCITDEKLIEAIYDSLAGQNISSFYNNGKISWRTDPVAEALSHFKVSFRKKYEQNNLRFSEFVAGVKDAVEKALAKDSESDAPIIIFQSLASSGLCFVNNVYDRKENVR